jgi:hypothetical protein
MARRDPQIRVLKKEYRAGPFPRWNNWVKDPLLARQVVAEISAFRVPGSAFPPLWFVSHSNGAVIALLAIRRLAELGVPVAGAIFTGAAIEADVERNGLLDLTTDYPKTCSEQGGLPGLRRPPDLGCAICWSSRGDTVTDVTPEPGESWLKRMRDWIWGRLAWPYGSLGATGWLKDGQPYEGRQFVTRWCPSSWGHGGYWTPERRPESFEQIRKTLCLPN